MDICGFDHMPEHIPRYMSRASDNNNALINNSLCFANRVIYTLITMTWDKGI